MNPSPPSSIHINNMPINETRSSTSSTTTKNQIPRSLHHQTVRSEITDQNPREETNQRNSMTNYNPITHHTAD
uniref:Uncharacterized protein n=1 Tax=Physcomitrium patens TaxID=3218 RepID=A0A2K1J6L8_PHYPA|nr:hypothetical protein PHYPA_020281 [Physcomitrium patens]